MQQTPPLATSRGTIPSSQSSHTSASLKPTDQKTFEAANKKLTTSLRSHAASFSSRASRNHFYMSSFLKTEQGSVEDVKKLSHFFNKIQPVFPLWSHFFFDSNGKKSKSINKLDEKSAEIIEGLEKKKLLLSSLKKDSDEFFIQLSSFIEATIALENHCPLGRVVGLAMAQELIGNYLKGKGEDLSEIELSNILLIFKKLFYSIKEDERKNLIYKSDEYFEAFDNKLENFEFKPTDHRSKHSFLKIKLISHIKVDYQLRHCFPAKITSLLDESFKNLFGYKRIAAIREKTTLEAAEKKTALFSFFTNYLEQLFKTVHILSHRLLDIISSEKGISYIYELVVFHGKSNHWNIHMCTGRFWRLEVTCIDEKIEIAVHSYSKLQKDTAEEELVHLQVLNLLELLPFTKGPHLRPIKKPSRLNLNFNEPYHGRQLSYTCLLEKKNQIRMFFLTLINITSAELSYENLNTFDFASYDESIDYPLKQEGLRSWDEEDFKYNDAKNFDYDFGDQELVSDSDDGETAGQKRRIVNRFFQKLEKNRIQPYLLKKPFAEKDREKIIKLKNAFFYIMPLVKDEMIKDDELLCQNILFVVQTLVPEVKSSNEKIKNLLTAIKNSPLDPGYKNELSAFVDIILSKHRTPKQKELLKIIIEQLNHVLEESKQHVGRYGLSELNINKVKDFVENNISILNNCLNKPKDAKEPLETILKFIKEEYENSLGYVPELISKLSSTVRAFLSDDKTQKNIKLLDKLFLFVKNNKNIASFPTVEVDLIQKINSPYDTPTQNILVTLAHIFSLLVPKGVALTEVNTGKVTTALTEAIDFLAKFLPHAPVQFSTLLKQALTKDRTTTLSKIKYKYIYRYYLHYEFVFRGAFLLELLWTECPIEMKAAKNKIFAEIKNYLQRALFPKLRRVRPPKNEKIIRLLKLLSNGEAEHAAHAASCLAQLPLDHLLRNSADLPAVIEQLKMRGFNH